MIGVEEDRHDWTQELSRIGFSSKELFVRGPALGSIFAFAYVVGYFYAIGIGWFAFFSFTDQLVFALRALPIAVGALVLFLVGISLSTGMHKLTWIIEYERQLFIILNFCWIAVLLSLSVLILRSGSIGATCSFIAISIGTGYFMTSKKPRPLLIHALYWGINITVLCLLLGYGSGTFWISGLYKHFGVDSMFVVPKESDSGTGSEKSKDNAMGPSVGHVLFSGTTGVLLYDYGYKRVRFTRWEGIEEISGCAESECTQELERRNRDWPHPID